MKPKIVKPVEVPQDRGPLLTDIEVAALLKLENPEGANARRWVRQNMLRWFRQDVLDWVASQGDAA
jgi:hypothetical protein